MSTINHDSATAVLLIGGYVREKNMLMSKMKLQRLKYLKLGLYKYYTFVTKRTFLFKSLNEHQKLNILNSFSASEADHVTIIEPIN